MWVLSQGINNPDLQTGDQTKEKWVITVEMFKNRIPLDYYFALFHFSTVLTESHTFTAHIILTLKTLMSKSWSFIFTFTQQPEFSNVA